MSIKSFLQEYLACECPNHLKDNDIKDLRYQMALLENIIKIKDETNYNKFEFLNNKLKDLEITIVQNTQDIAYLRKKRSYNRKK